MVLIGISLMISDVCWAFFHVLVGLLYVLDTCLFRSFPHCSVFNWIILFYLLLSCLYTLDINPLSDMWFAPIFLYSIGCSFTLLLASFAASNTYWTVLISQWFAALLLSYIQFSHISGSFLNANHVHWSICLILHLHFTLFCLDMW